MNVLETGRLAPADYGPGAGRPQPRTMRLGAAPMATSQAIPASDATAATGGSFGPAVTWPIIPVHMILLPDGRVMSYGTDQNGQQGAKLIYDVWDPRLGTGSNAHLVLPNTTGTDIFCSAQSMLWGSGTTLITGGDRTVAGRRNYANNLTTIFDPAKDTIASGASMQYPRWYPSIVPMPNGEMLVVGGRNDPGIAIVTPEVYNPLTGWRTLQGATSAAAFTNYVYPRGYVTPAGNVFLLNVNGLMYSMTAAATGTIAPLAAKTTTSSIMLPTAMYAPGKLLSLRLQAAAVTVDLNGSQPVVGTTPKLSQLRNWASETVLPDGQVLVTGGSLVGNQLIGVAYNTELWSPATGKWTLGAAAAKPRLYHSNALLLPDATVLTGGGGAPGPVMNLNAEIYYPPYLYLPSGQPATRPTLSTAPVSVKVGGTITASVQAADRINRVTFVRTGSATHSSNLEQRFLDLPFSQNGNVVTATLPGNANVVLPGYWMLFVWQGGVPSVAKIVLVPSQT